ncbi:MAG TPA: hypothetical protein VFH83_13675, partial [Spirochaetia bacterium]|nr:hypothetical protein [Spirochaetia bacterium]
MRKLASLSAALILAVVAPTIAMAQAGGSGSTAPTAGTSTTAAASGPDLSVPQVAAKAWTVGFSAFSSEGLSTGNGYLSYSLPLMILGALNGLDTHHFSAAETAAIQRQAIAASMQTAEQALSSSIQSRDALLFAAQQDAATRTGADQKVGFAQARILFLTSFDPSQVAVPASLPIVFKDGSSTAKLFDAPAIPLAELCASQGLDLLVAGSLREVQGYLLVDVWAYDAHQDQTVFSYREAAPRDEIYSYMPTIS